MKAPAGFKERILLMGGPGTGKTHSWLTIAKRNPDSTFYVLDTEPKQAVARALATNFPDIENVEVTTAWDWETYREATADATKKMKPDDWLIVDMMTYAWSAVQEYYANKVFKDDLDNIFLAARQQGKRALEGWVDWNVINPMYNKWSTQLITARGHVLGTAGVDQFSAETEQDKDMRRMFGPYGVKPRGQKHMSHNFHTVIWTQAPKPGDWKMVTIRDDGRQTMDGAENKDFATSYLLKVAGWKP